MRKLAASITALSLLASEPAVAYQTLGLVIVPLVSLNDAGN